MLGAKVNEQRRVRGESDLNLDVGDDPPGAVETLIGKAVAALGGSSTELAKAFSRHSISEGIGARTIEAVSRSHATGFVAECLLEHAADEFKHHRIFANIANRIMPGIVPDAELESREANDNRAFLEAFDGNVVRFVCDTHVAEVRNLVVLHAYRAVTNASDEYRRLDVPKAIDVILSDEITHVSYTGRLIDVWLREGHPVATYLADACVVYDAAVREDYGSVE